MSDGIVVITGSTSGIGRELCALYRAAGATVIGIARSADGATDIAADVTDTAALHRAIDAVGQRYGHIDTVIACAGGGLSGATEILPLEEIEKQTALNYTGAAETVRAALEYMSSGGRVVFISSACALFALPYRAYYCATKAAVNMVAYGLYMELKAHGIRVSTVCPGDIKTGFTAHRVKYSDGGARYGSAPRLAAEKLDARESKRMDVRKAAKKIYKCARSCRKPMYIVGFKYKVLNFLRHILPQKAFLDVTAKLFG